MCPLYAALLLAIWPMPLVCSLYMQTSFQLLRQLSAPAVDVLVRVGLEEFPNLARLYALALVGENGLSDAFANACFPVSPTSLGNVLRFIGDDVARQIRFVPFSCYQLLCQEPDLLAQLPPSLRAIWPTFEELEGAQGLAGYLKRADATDPMARWWPQVMPYVNWRIVELNMDVFVDGPLYQLMLIRRYELDDPHATAIVSRYSISEAWGMAGWLDVRQCEASIIQIAIAMLTNPPRGRAGSSPDPVSYLRPRKILQSISSHLLATSPGGPNDRQCSLLLRAAQWLQSYLEGAVLPPVEGLIVDRLDPTIASAGLLRIVSLLCLLGPSPLRCTKALLGKLAIHIEQVPDQVLGQFIAHLSFQDPKIIDTALLSFLTPQVRHRLLALSPGVIHLQYHLMLKTVDHLEYFARWFARYDHSYHRLARPLVLKDLYKISAYCIPPRRLANGSDTQSAITALLERIPSQAVPDLRPILLNKFASRFHQAPSDNAKGVLAALVVLKLYFGGQGLRVSPQYIDNLSDRLHLKHMLRVAFPSGILMCLKDTEQPASRA